MGKHDVNLLKWVTKQLADITGRGSIDRLELWHVVEGEHADKCGTFEVGDDTDPNEVVREMWEVAENDVSTLPSGRHNRYVVQSFRGEREVENSYKFVLDGGFTHPFLGNETEPPTEKGHTAQLMRHNNDNHEMVLHASRMVQALPGMLMRRLEDVEGRLAERDKIVVDMYERYQDLLNQDHERKMAQAREENKERRHDQWMTLATSVLPAMISQYVASKGITSGPVQDSLMGRSIIGFLGSLTNEQLGEIMPKLRPDQQIVAMELLKASKQQYMKEQSEKPRILRDKGIDESELPGETTKH